MKILTLVKSALSGILAAGTGVIAGELLAALISPKAGPLEAIGGVVIDATPTSLKELAIRQFGTNDKLVLMTTIIVGIFLITALVGILGARRRIFAVVGAVLFGIAGMLAALTRPASSFIDIFPSLLAAIIAAPLLLLLLSKISSERYITVTPERGKPWLLDRRRFVGTALLVASGAAVGGGATTLARRVKGGQAADARASIKLPAPAITGPKLPEGLDSSFITPNDKFYRVDVALTVPRVDVDTWTLKIHGMVEKELTLTFEDLLRMPLVERYITLNCVSNEVGGPYIGTAKWLGVRLAPLLQTLGVSTDSDQLIATSVDGMTIGTPTKVVFDGRDVLLAVGMNGEPLPLEHGFPVRMITPGLYGFVGACKWISDIELTTFAKAQSYWTRRKWASDAPVKTASRVDKPAPFSRTDAGKVNIMGVAWAQERGISQVEISIDGGKWLKTDLLPVPSIDTWVQWRYAWQAASGSHTVQVRATDGNGKVQTEQRVGPFPNGSSGWQTTTFMIN